MVTNIRGQIWTLLLFCGFAHGTLSAGPDYNKRNTAWTVAAGISIVTGLGMVGFAEHNRAEFDRSSECLLGEKLDQESGDGEITETSDLDILRGDKKLWKWIEVGSVGVTALFSICALLAARSNHKKAIIEDEDNEVKRAFLLLKDALGAGTAINPKQAQARAGAPLRRRSVQHSPRNSQRAGWAHDFTLIQELCKSIAHEKTADLVERFEKNPQDKGAQVALNQRASDIQKALKRMKVYLMSFKKDGEGVEGGGVEQDPDIRLHDDASNNPLFGQVRRSAQVTKKRRRSSASVAPSEAGGTDSDGESAKS